MNTTREATQESQLARAGQIFEETQSLIEDLKFQVADNDDAGDLISQIEGKMEEAFSGNVALMTLLKMMVDSSEYFSKMAIRFKNNAVVARPDHTLPYEFGAYESRAIVRALLDIIEGLGKVADSSEEAFEASLDPKNFNKGEGTAWAAMDKVASAPAFKSRKGKRK